MRSFIALAAAVAVLAGYPALAEDWAGHGSYEYVPSFAEDGVYIPAGQMVEVTIAGECHRFTNHDKRIGFFFSPSEPDSWPDERENNRAPLEPKVTEAPCK